ncbi:WhiB family transcriptional regulator [Streptomyces sp. CB00072]|uniref:WhiB family transcriptional regulator n=1 Tax=Streptomyces sp. CB00072 TaxID=1703928 RepID=UPI00093A89B2|nr:WhiB family transcriptional regulator [Streptomyces sp. CB00072]
MSLDWMASALCATNPDPDLWFSAGVAGDKAKKICGNCPVRTQCEEYARELEGTACIVYRHGVWGGTSAYTRSRTRARGAARFADRTAKILRLAETGLPPEEIASLVGVTTRTVFRAKRTQREKAVAA